MRKIAPPLANVLRIAINPTPTREKLGDWQFLQPSAIITLATPAARAAL
jgi:hypothetical protein